MRNVWSLIVVLLLSATANGQDWARKMFETTTHDFGSVARGAKVEFHFKFSNIYLEDVHISGVRSSCACTAPRIAKDTLKTYDESAIIAEFNTHSFQGHRSATITVNFDKPFPAEVQLHVSGYIRTDVVLTPGSVDLGTIDQGETASKTISVRYAGRSDWKIVDVRPNSPHIHAAVQETGRGGGQVAYDLTVEVDPQAPVGYVKDQVVLVTNEGTAGQIPVDVTGRVISEITISPSSLFLGVLQPGQKVTKQLVVQGKRAFRVTGVECDAQSFQFQVPDVAKTVHLIPVTYTAPHESGRVEQKIVIRTDLGESVSPECTAYAQILTPTASQAAN